MAKKYCGWTSCDSHWDCRTRAGWQAIWVHPRSRCSYIEASGRSRDAVELCFVISEVKDQLFFLLISHPPQTYKIKLND